MNSYYTTKIKGWCLCSSSDIAWTQLARYKYRNFNIYEYVRYLCVPTTKPISNMIAADFYSITISDWNLPQASRIRAIFFGHCSSLKLKYCWRFWFASPSSSSALAGIQLASGQHQRRRRRLLRLPVVSAAGRDAAWVVPKRRPLLQLLWIELQILPNFRTFCECVCVCVCVCVCGGARKMLRFFLTPWAYSRRYEGTVVENLFRFLSHSFR